MRKPHNVVSSKKKANESMNYSSALYFYHKLVNGNMSCVLHFFCLNILNFLLFLLPRNKDRLNVNSPIYTHH
jgi:hypothetical protein